MLNVKLVKEIEKKNLESHELVKVVTHVNRSEASQMKKL
jgi:RNA-binding protein YhbY